MSSRKQSLFHELRAAFLPASLLAVFVGTALAFYRTGRWHWPLFIVCVGGVGAIHAGANVLNDYCDHLGGSDAANTEFVRPFTGGSRLIQQGRLTPREVRAFGLVLLAVGVTIGLSLVWWCGIGVLAFLAPAILVAVAYSVPRIGLAARGLGEVAVALAFGVLGVTGSYFVQTGHISSEAFFVSLPLAVLVGAVLFINQFQDYAADCATGKRNWVVRLGRQRASRAYTCILTLGVMLPASEAVVGLAPVPLAWATGSAIFAVPAILCARQHFDDPARLTPANVFTIATHTVVAIIAGGALVIARVMGYVQ